MQKHPMTVTVERPSTAADAHGDVVVVKISGEIGLTALLGEHGEHGDLVT